MDKKTLLIIGSVAAIILAGIIFIVLNSGSQSPVAQQRQLFDVLTGERRSMSAQRLVTVPVRNANGQDSLFPIAQDESGTWVIPERFQSVLMRMIEDGELPRDGLKVDLQTFAIQR